MGKTVYAGEGCVFMAPVDSDGALTGDYVQVGNAYPFSVQITTEQKKQISRLCDSAGQTLAVRSQISESVGSLTLKQWNAKNLAYALAGEEVALVGSGGSVTAEEVTAPASGSWARFANPNVSAVVVMDDADVTTYIEGTDYYVNLDLGMIEILVGGSITAGDVLHVDYTYAAETGYQVKIGSKAVNRVAILATLTNSFTGDKMQIELYSVVVSSSAEVNFISEPDTEYEELPLTLTLETPTGKTVPGVVNGIEM